MTTPTAFPEAPSSPLSRSNSLPESPTIRTLANGLTIIAEQMPIESVNLSLWLNLGSRVESDEINGMAHFLEHMIFKGTPQINCGEFERLVEERGAVMNAATSQDYTHYYINTAPQDFATLAPLQIELVMNPSFADEHFNRERPVILEEIRRAQDSPQRRTFYRAMEMSFDRLPYRRSVLGPASVVSGLTAEQMRAFHHTWYQPSNMTAVAVGNLPVEDLIRIVEEGFDQALERGDRTAFTADLISQVPATQSESPFYSIHRTEYTDDTLQQARLVMGWRVPGMRDLTKTYPLDVVASVLSSGRLSRLKADLREQRHLVNGISVSNMSFGAQGVFYVLANLPAENVPAVEAAIVEHIQRLQNEFITETELRRVQTQVANRYVFGSETPSDRAGLYGYYQAMTGDIRHALDYPDWIRRVTIEDVQAAVRQYLPVDAYGVVLLKPSSQEL